MAISRTDVLVIVSALSALAGCDGQTRHEANGTGPNEQAPVAQPAPAPAPTLTPVPTPTARSIMQPSVILESTPTAAPLAPISETIHFPKGGSRLDDAGKATLDKLVEDPTTGSGGPIVLRGSSDSAGNDRDNLATSRKRAEAVAAYLTSKGVAPDRLTVIALGEGRPLAPNVNLDGSDNPEGRARNRRVEITIEPKSEHRPAISNEDGAPAPGSTSTKSITGKAEPDRPEPSGGHRSRKGPRGLSPSD